MTDTIELQPAAPRDLRIAVRPGLRHLYIHIPFCHRRCAYCDFNTYANMDDRMAAYVGALCAELAALRVPESAPPPTRPAGAPPEALTRADLRPTIFLGGGTPSMLPLPLMERVLAAADAIIPLASAEVTVEANPGTVLGRDYLRGLRALGVNRLSMGVQSLHDPTLRVLGRIHTAAEARESYADARRAGFDNINLDFMFGLPGQDAAQWDATLREIVTWGAEHFSLYSLILEESTPLFAQVTAGRTSVPDDDATGEMYERAIELLGAGGYAQYEISNWARARGMGDGESGRGKLSPTPNPQLPSPTSLYACHHNLAYWLNADYLAAGAGAHGHVFPQRYADVLGIDEYVARVAAGRMPVAEISELGARDLYAETMFMGLRLNVGVSYAHFRERCGAELPAIYPAELADLEARGLLVRDALGVRLSARGRMLGNQVFEAFV